MSDVPSQAPPDLSAPVRVVLVRHGVTEYTRTGRLDGRGGADPDLSDEGLAQAAAAARGIGPLLTRHGADGVRVLTSSLRRARRTGAAIAEALDVTADIEVDLDELGFGVWDGLTFGEITRGDPEAITRSRSEDVPPEGGETYAHLRARVVAALDRLVAEARETGETLVLVTHHGPIAVVLAHVLNLDISSVWRLAVDPCSFTTLCVWRDGGLLVEAVNDTAHLR